MPYRITVIEVDPATTWALVRTSPSGLITIPVPVPYPPAARRVLIETTPGRTLASSTGTFKASPLKGAGTAAGEFPSNMVMLPAPTMPPTIPAGTAATLMLRQLGSLWKAQPRKRAHGRDISPLRWECAFWATARASVTGQARGTPEYRRVPR